MPINQLMFYPEPYNPGFTIIKQFDTIKSGATQGATLSDDIGDLSVELQPGNVYRIFMVLRFMTVSGGGAPGVAVTFVNDANLTYLFMENRGNVNWQSDTSGSFASTPHARPFHQEMLATPYYNLSTDFTANNVYVPVFNGIVACENAPVQFSPRWCFANTGANGRTDFKAGSWMWVRKEATL